MNTSVLQRTRVPIVAAQRPVFSAVPQCTFHRRGAVIARVYAAGGSDSPLNRSNFNEKIVPITDAEINAVAQAGGGSGPVKGGSGGGKSGGGGKPSGGGSEGSGPGKEPSASFYAGWKTVEYIKGFIVVSAVLFALNWLYTKFVKPSVSPYVASGVDTVQGWEQSAERGAEKGLHKAEKGAHKAGEGIKSLPGQVRHGVDKLKEKGHDAKVAAGDKYNSAALAVNDAVHKHVEPKVAEKEKEVENALKEAPAATRGWLDGAKDAVSGVAHKVAGGAEAAEAKLKHGFESAESKLGFKKKSKLSGSGVAKGAAVAVPLAATIAAATTGAALLIGGTVAFVYDKKHGDKSGKAVREGKKKIGKFAEDVKDAVQSKLPSSGEVKANASAVADKAKTQAHGQLQAKGNTPTDLVKDAKDVASKETAKEAKENTKL